jgi:hypothetical protein
MRREENVEQVVIAQLIVVEGDPDRLGVTGIASANLLIGGVGHVTAGVTAFDGLHSDDIEEHGLGAPEAPAGQDCDLV